MSHDEILDGVEEEAEGYKEPKWKKPLTMIIAIFLLFLILGYYLVYTDALIGIIKSKTLQETTLQANDITITFKENSLKVLQEEYVKNEHREIKACLYGEANGKEYKINKIEFPKILSASVIHISTPGCPADAIIDLHSHPINRCVPSQQDINNFARNKQTNPELIMMIMCWKNRFSVTV